MPAPNAIQLIAWWGAGVGPLLAILLWFHLRPVDRRSATARLGFLVFTFLYGVSIWSFLIEPETLVVRRTVIQSPQWRGPPLRIGVLADTHVGAPHVTPERVRKVVARLSAERPDVIVFLGDYAGGHNSAELRPGPGRSMVLRGVAALGAASAPLGRVAILGNHDWWYDGPAIETMLRTAGIPVLENGSVRVARPGAPFWIAGLADEASKRAKPSAEMALRDVPPHEAVILLSHRPDPFPSVPSRVALTIAAHTHCGQVNLPVLGRLISASPGSARWPCGFYEEGGRKMYVTGGLGTSILPLRFRAPPEIVIITLSGPDG